MSASDPEALAESIAAAGREELLKRFRAAFGQAAGAHADYVNIDAEKLEAMVQRSVSDADGLQWRRALAGVAAHELGIELTAALTHPAVVRAHQLAGAPSYEQALGELAVPVPPAPVAPVPEPPPVPTPTVAPVVPEAALEPEVEAEPEAAVEPEAEAEPEAEVEPEVEAEPEAEPEVESEPEVTGGLALEPTEAPELGAGDEPEATPEAEAEVEPEPELEVEPEPQQGTEPEAEEPDPADSDDADFTYEHEILPAGTAIGSGSNGAGPPTDDVAEFSAVHLGGVAQLPSSEEIALRLSEEGLDLIQDDGAIVGRLGWEDISALEVTVPHGRRRRKGSPRLVVHTAGGSARFEVPSLSGEELQSQLQPLMARYGH